MRVLNYQDWCEIQVSEFRVNNSHVDDCWACDESGEVECEYCEGWGETEDEFGDTQECHACDGEGYVKCLSCGGKDESPAERSDYRNQVIEDAHNLSSWTGRDLLSVFGEFVKAGAL